MPWSIVQENSGTSTTTSGNITLGTGTTAGNTLIVVFGRVGTTLTFTGFTLDTGVSNAVGVFRKTAVAAETSWAYSVVSAVPLAWAAMEISDLDNSSPVDTKPSAVSTALSASTVDTFTTGTNNSSTTYDGLVLAAHTAQNSASTVVPTWSGYGQGLVERFDFGVASATQAASLAVSLAQNLTPTIWDVAATSSSSASTLTATHVVYVAVGARRAPMLDAICGFEFGTTAGLATALAQSAFDVVTGTPTIVSGDPLATGNYCMQIAAAASIVNVVWDPSGVFALYGSPTNAPAVVHGAFWFPTLPGADLVIVNCESSTGILVRYVSASQKIGVKVGSGTERLSANTVSAGVRYALDLRAVASTSAASADWQLDGVDQTQATGTTASNTGSPVTFGTVASSTGTVRWDDLAVSHIAGQYPIGNIKVYPLLPTATLTASTAADFQTFTANGTNAAWNAATALAAIDEIPPTIGASADGIVQAVSSATDFVEVPMQTRNAAANGEAIRAVRWYFPGWAASTTAATIGFRGWDGTTETTVFAAADPGFDNSTTVPMWVCRMHRTIGSASPRVITQAQLDALTARIGYGNAAVKVGVHAVLAEVAMRVDTTTQAMFGDAADPTTVQVNVSRDPDSDGVVTLTTTATEHQGADIHYEVNAAGTDVAVGVGASSTAAIGAVDHPTTNYVALYPDPEGVADT